VNLNAFAAEKRRAIFDSLRAGHDPAEGSFNAETLKEGRMKGAPQVGSTRYEPHAIHFEFIFPDPSTTATVFTVTIVPTERIVFLPVPEWVIESIWQGDIDGSYHFESDAMTLMESFRGEVEPDKNLTWFGPRQAKRRE
jgi:hypothetical protein